ncbi:hypothetical protein N752_20230 [Desulforamulus aquiferis]|nr:hypothetical protein N752_20230 [Desulforamulus aquiferis]
MSQMTGGRQPNHGVNPDEVVAVGAAIQAGILAGEVKDVVLLDVTPLSLGLETLGGVMSRIIERNTTIPVRRSQVFSTAEDNQPAVDIHVLQGEREMARDNRSLGQFKLAGIPMAPRGIPQIEVTFDIDANGILKVSAKDKASSKEQMVTISGSSSLDRAEVEKMISEASANAEEDKKRRQEAEIKNEADSLIYQVERQIKEVGDKLPIHEKARIEQLTGELKLAINENRDVEGIRSLASDLKQAALSVAQYTTVENGCGSGSCDTGNKDRHKDDDVIDAEFEEK